MEPSAALQIEKRVSGDIVRLNLSSNMLDDIPPKLEKMKLLESLDLSCNRLKCEAVQPLTVQRTHCAAFQRRPTVMSGCSEPKAALRAAHNPDSCQLSKSRVQP